MTLLDKVREALRITHNRLDNEFQDAIDTCKADLKLAGITKLDETDPLIQQAIKTYVKAEYEEDIYKRAALNQSYTSLKISLCLCGDYTEDGE